MIPQVYLSLRTNEVWVRAGKDAPFMLPGQPEPKYWTFDELQRSEAPLVPLERAP